MGLADHCDNIIALIDEAVGPTAAVEPQQPHRSPWSAGRHGDTVALQQLWDGGEALVSTIDELLASRGI